MRHEINIEGIIGHIISPDSCIENIKTKICELKLTDADELVVNIRSTGGNMSEAIPIYKVLKELPCKVITRCYGYVASAATIIAQAASEGCRKMSDNGLWLICKTKDSVEGNSDQLYRKWKQLNELDQKCAEIYSKGLTFFFFHYLKMMDENNGYGKWLTAQEALQNQLIDSIFSDSSLITKE